MKKKVEYSIEHRTSGGEWVEEGLYFDTYKEAAEEIQYCPEPAKNYRIVENHLTVLWER